MVASAAAAASRGQAGLDAGLGLLLDLRRGLLGGAELELAREHAHGGGAEQSGDGDLAAELGAQAAGAGALASVTLRAARALRSSLPLAVRGRASTRT